MRCILWIAAVAYGILSVFAMRAAGAVVADTERRSGGIRWLDATHEFLCDGVQDLSENVDRFFDRTADEEAGATRLKVTTGTELREGGGIRFRTGASGRLDLPRFERRMNLLLEDIDLSEDTLKEQDVGDEVVAGLRFLLRQTRRTRLQADGGLRFSGAPILFGRLRLRRQYVMDRQVTRITQFIHWYDRQGFGEETRFEYERSVGDGYLAQSRSTAAWGETTSGLDWSQTVSLTRLLRHRQGWEIFGVAKGITHPTFRLESYRSAIRYRNRLYRHWLFAEIVPGLDYRRENGFEPEPFVVLQIESIFGR